MQMMAHNPEKSKSGAGPSKKVAEEMIRKTSKTDRSRFMKKK